MRKWIEHWKEKLGELYRWADPKMGGVPSIINDALHHFKRVRAAEAAASMAYFVIFSLFPLLLSVIVIASFFMETARVQYQLLILLREIFPVGPSMILENIQEVLEARSTFGVAGGVGLLWAASSAFNTLFRNINRAWLNATPLNVFKSRLLGVGIIIVLVVLLVLVRYASALVNLLPAVAALLGEDSSLYDSLLWLFLSSLVPLILTFFIFLGLYRWIPNSYVTWSEAFWGALLAALLWELTTIIFTWLLGSGIANYQLVYGSLGIMIALLFWIYLNSMIVFFCAHLSAAIARKERPYAEDVIPTPEAEEASEWH